MLFVLVLLNLIFYTYSDEVTVSIDGVELHTEWKKTLAFDGSATYHYRENELVRVNCLWSNIGDVKIELRDENKLNWFKETREITFMIKLRTGTYDQYVDCYHIDAKKTVVRIMFKKLNPVMEYQDPWTVKINEMEWNPRPNRIEYKYVLGEELYASCLQTNYSSEMVTDPHSRLKLNTMQLNHTFTCSNAGNETQVLFYLLDTERISGLRSSNILFWFSDLSNVLIIHYEYEENEHLDLSWSVKPLDDQKNYYTVYIKDKQLLEVPDLKSTGKYVNLNISITLRGDDHGSTIQFWRSTIDEVKFLPHKEIWIKLRMKRTLPSEQLEVKPGHKNSKLGFYGGVGSGVVSLILILIIVLYLIKRRKQNVPRDESPDNYYGNLTNEETTIPPFPSQWDTYANTQADLNKDVQDLYAKPVPKSLRKGKIPDNNDNVDVSETDLYSQVRDSVNSYKDSAGYANVR